MPLPNPRVIALDEAQLHELIEDLLAELIDAADGVPHKFGKRRVVFEDVRGNKKNVKIGLKRLTKRAIYKQVVHGAHYTPKTETVIVDVHVPSLKAKLQHAANGDTTRSAVLHGVERELRSALIHELTHVRDVIQSSSVQKSRVRGLPWVASDYINSPHEVRAYAREIAEAVGRRFEQQPARLSGAELERLVHEEGHPYHYYLMRDENKQRVLRIVTRYLEDQGLLL